MQERDTSAHFALSKEVVTLVQPLGKAEAVTS